MSFSKTLVAAIGCYALLAVLTVLFRPAGGIAQVQTNAYVPTGTLYGGTNITIAPIGTGPNYTISSSGGGTNITSGAGDFGTGTSQSGGVLTGVVTNGSNMAGSASIPDSALATPHLSNGVAGKVQLSDGSGNFTGVSMSQDATMNGSGVVDNTGLLTKALPSLPGAASALTYDGVSAWAFQPYFANPLNGLDTFLQGAANVNTAPTAGSLPNCTDTGGNHLNYSTSTHNLSCGTSIGTIPSNPAFSATNSVGGQAGSNQSVMFEDAPPWAHYLCDGSEADPGPTSFSVQGTHCYAALTINNGQTITVTSTASSAGTATDKPNGALIAYVQGACTIAGTITATQENAAQSYGGGSGGGGGFGAANGTAGNSSNIQGGSGVSSLASGGAAGTSGVAGGIGTALTSSAQKMMWTAAPVFGNYGGAAGGAGGSSGGAGGGGGGAVILICGSINFTGTINASGTAGGAGGSSTGGGGGGGGGIVLLAARTVTNSGSINVAHGAGGAIGTGTSTAGGNGGDGWSKVFTLN